MRAQVKLDAAWNGQLIYVERDADSSIRREKAPSVASAASSPSSRRLAQQHQQQQAQQHIQQRQAAREQAAAKGAASGSKISQARVGRRASTIGLRPSSSKLGGKYGRGPARARAVEQSAAPRGSPRDASRDGEDAAIRQNL